MRLGATPGSRTGCNVPSARIDKGPEAVEAASGPFHFRLPEFRGHACSSPGREKVALAADPQFFRSDGRHHDVSRRACSIA